MSLYSILPELYSKYIRINQFALAMKVPLDKLTFVNYPIIHVEFAIAVIPAIFILPFVFIA
jgi:hypothetical protein